MFEIIYHPLYGELHDTDQPKPAFESYENPNRCKIIWEYLKKIGYVLRDFRATAIQTNTEKSLVIRKPAPLDKKDLFLVHTQYYIDKVECFTKAGCGQLGDLVLATEDLMEIGLLSAGGAYEAIKDVATKKYNQSFAIIRPPGHHSTPDTADGLCVFNNIALAIKKMRKELDFKEKIVIIDIDAHFGNGLSSIFYQDPTVLYTSIHEYDFLTYDEGFFDAIGLKNGLGYNINFPVPFKAGDTYLEKYCNFIEPFIIKYQPEIIIIATGLDGHWADPIGNLSFSSQGYIYFTNWLKRVSKEVCQSRVCFCLEGGYNLIMIPRLIEILISEFISQPIKNTIDDLPSKHYFSNSVADESFMQSYDEQLKILKKRLERIWNIVS